MARLRSNGTLDTTFMEQAYLNFVGLINLTNGLAPNFPSGYGH